MEKIVLPEPPKAPTAPWTRTYNTYTSRYVYSGLNIKTLKEYKAKIKLYEEAYKEYDRRRSEIVKMVASFLRESGFPDTRRVKVTSRAKYPKYQSERIEQVLLSFLPYESRVSLSTVSEEESLRTDDKEKEKKLESINKIAYRDKAVNFCISHGKKYGEDFTAETAIGLAEDIAFDLEVEKRRKDLKISNTFIDFNGNNCGDSWISGDYAPCAGWDGESRRCDCGNRRVGWEKVDGFNFEDPHIYAEAW